MTVNGEIRESDAEEKIFVVRLLKNIFKADHQNSLQDGKMIGCGKVLFQ